MLTTCLEKSALKYMFWLCLQGCDLRSDEWVTASCLSLSETLTTLRTGTELSISKRNRHFWTNMDRNDRHEITSHGRLDKKYVRLLIQWGTRTCGVQLGKNAKITVTNAHLRQCWGLKLEVSTRLAILHQDSLIRTVYPSMEHAVSEQVTDFITAI